MLPHAPSSGRTPIYKLQSLTLENVRIEDLGVCLSDVLALFTHIDELCMYSSSTPLSQYRRQGDDTSICPTCHLHVKSRTLDHTYEYIHAIQRSLESQTLEALEICCGEQHELPALWRLVLLAGKSLQRFKFRLTGRFFAFEILNSVYSLASQVYFHLVHHGLV